MIFPCFFVLKKHSFYIVKVKSLLACLVVNVLVSLYPPLKNKISFSSFMRLLNLHLPKPKLSPAKRTFGYSCSAYLTSYPVAFKTQGHFSYRVFIGAYNFYKLFLACFTLYVKLLLVFLNLYLVFLIIISLVAPLDIGLVVVCATLTKKRLP